MSDKWLNIQHKERKERSRQERLHNGELVNQRAQEARNRQDRRS